MLFYDDFLIPDILPPREDGVFKSLMTREAAKPLLCAMVSSLLDITVHDVSVRNIEPPITGIDEKREKFDVNVTTDTGDQLEIEMQAEAMKEDTLLEGQRNIKSRAVFNLCDLHKSQHGRGKPYDALLRSFQATLCGYTVFPDDKRLVHRFSFLEATDHFQLTDDVGVIFLELTKLEETLKKKPSEMTMLEALAVFFAKADDPKSRPLIEMLSKEKEEIGLADELLMGISKDDVERAHFRSRRLYVQDRENELAFAKRAGERIGEQRGIQVGEQRGMRAAQFQMALKMKEKGMADSDITELTGLTWEEVHSLQ